MSLKNKKAIVVYIDAHEKGEIEFSWLWKSWLLWDINKTWDLVAFVNPKIEKTISEKYKAEGLVVKPTIPLYEKDKYWNRYKYVNSFGMFEFEENINFIIKNYDFIFRTDCDTFLTKGFKEHSSIKTIEIGLGAQTFTMNDTSKIEEVESKLKEIRDTLNLNNNRIKNVGASILGLTQDVITTTHYHFKLTRYILEICFKNGKYEGEWPGWFWGIASMYAIELAVSHLFNPSFVRQGTVDVWCGPEIIDSYVKQIHAWQCKDIDGRHFDKVQWFIENKEKEDLTLREIKKRRGGNPTRLYKNLKFDKLPTTAGDYCLAIVNHDLEYLKSLV
tara:strand:+ start:3695 stop:4687 length:993 start_codon:yes stop_codon:yes gene_type:complete